MCFAIPGKIKKIKGKYALVDFGGTKKDIKIILTPEVKVDDYLFVRAGFSVKKITKKEANKALKILSNI